MTLILDNVFVNPLGKSVCVCNCMHMLGGGGGGGEGAGKENGGRGRGFTNIPIFSPHQHWPCIWYILIIIYVRAAARQKAHLLSSLSLSLYMHLFHKDTHITHTQSHAHTHTHTCTHTHTYTHTQTHTHTHANTHTHTHTHTHSCLLFTMWIFKQLNEDAFCSWKSVISLSIGKWTWDVDQVVCPCYLQSTLPTQEKACKQISACRFYVWMCVYVTVYVHICLHV